LCACVQTERVRKDSNRVGVKRKCRGELREILFLEGKIASFCYNIPRHCPLVFLVRYKKSADLKVVSSKSLKQILEY
jgi:hypothetical protein